MNAADIAGALEARKMQVLKHLFPAGKIIGHEFCIGNIAGIAGRSLKVNLNGKGTVWADFNGGEQTGGDLLDLWAAARCNGDKAPAMKEAAAWLGITDDRPRPRSPEGMAKRPDTHPDLGKPDIEFEYTAASGTLLGEVWRWDARGDGDKEFRPLTLRDGRWHWRAPAEPRPLYGLADLAARPDAPVLIVEGEKTVTGARDHLPDFVCMTWSGGANAVGKADFRPLRNRRVVLWPDNDDGGRKAMRQALEMIRAAGGSGAIVDLPEGLPPKWDLGDPLPRTLSDLSTPAVIAAEAEQRIGDAPSQDGDLQDIDAAEARGLVVLFDPSTLAGKPVPPRVWLVTDWIPSGFVTALYGDGGTGKSTLAQTLQTCCSLGHRWLGLPTMRCRTFSWFCEDDQDELHRRQEAINAALGVGFSDLGDMRWESRLGLDNVLMTFNGGVGQLTDLFEALRREAVAFAAKLVVIDTAADVFGGNENDRQQVRQFIQGCLGRLARAIGGTVLLCAHPSRTGLTSGEGDGGNTAWNNTVRSRMYLAHPGVEGDAKPDELARVLSRKKANYAARGETIDLRWDRGVFVPVREPAGVFASIADQKAERVFLEGLDTLRIRGVNLSPARSATNFGPTEILKAGLAQGCKRQELGAAMNKLFAGGLITTENYGRPSDEKSRIVRAPGRSNGAHTPTGAPPPSEASAPIGV